jgi:hypothetical protein
MLQHKRHSSPDVDDEKLRAAKAFLEQHLKQAGGSDAAGAAAAAAVVAAAAGGSKDRDKDRSKDRSKEKKEKVAGSLPAGLPLLTPDDYFERAAEFTAWLQEIKHQYFNGEVLKQYATRRGRFWQKRCVQPGSFLMLAGAVQSSSSAGQQWLRHLATDGSNSCEQACLADIVTNAKLGDWTHM